MKLDEFEVTTAVVHYVPTEDEEALILTDEAITLDADLKRYFRDKIVERLSVKGLEAVVDPTQPQVVPEAVAATVKDATRLVATSQEIATHLDSIQTRINSTGLLAVVLGAVGDMPCLAVIKLEREHGIRFAIDTIEGRHIVDLEFLRNLTLTDKTKVYKTALLTCPTPGRQSGRGTRRRRSARHGRWSGSSRLLPRPIPWLQAEGRSGRGDVQVREGSELVIQRGRHERREEGALPGRALSSDAGADRRDPAKDVRRPAP
jgi:hypothetical protein